MEYCKSQQHLNYFYLRQLLSFSKTSIKRLPALNLNYKHIMDSYQDRYDL